MNQNAIHRFRRFTWRGRAATTHAPSPPKTGERGEILPRGTKKLEDRGTDSQVTKSAARTGLSGIAWSSIAYHSDTTPPLLVRNSLLLALLQSYTVPATIPHAYIPCSTVNCQLSTVYQPFPVSDSCHGPVSPFCRGHRALSSQVVLVESGVRIYSNGARCLTAGLESVHAPRTPGRASLLRQTAFDSNAESR